MVGHHTVGDDFDAAELGKFGEKAGGSPSEVLEEELGHRRPGRCSGTRRTARRSPKSGTCAWYVVATISPELASH